MDNNKVLASSFPTFQSLTENYIFPEELRPGNHHFPDLDRNVPIIDLGLNDTRQTIHQILEASLEFGFFQVINHGVSANLMEEAMNVFKEFHSMAIEDRITECSKDPDKKYCKFYTSSDKYTTETIHYWRNALTHSCHKDSMQFWPQKPSTYWDVVGRYSSEVKKLGYKILELISEGLELESGYFNGGLTESPVILINHYPPCNDPTLTLGMAGHQDPSVITILQQDDVHGFQIFKDNEWIGVKPLPYAFLVNIGYLLQVITNGRVIASEHRVVTNASKARTTASLFMYPSEDTIIEPAKALTEEQNMAPVYRAFTYRDFRDAFSLNRHSIREFVSLSVCNTN